jgi:Beta-1,4-xylanase
MSKKVVAVFTLMVFLFTMIPITAPKAAEAVTVAPITLYDMDSDTNLTVGASLSDPALVKSGDAEISVVSGTDGTKSLYLQKRTNSWDGVDLLRTVFKQVNNTYWTGNYTFTVKGHVNPEDKASSPKFVLGQSAGSYGWLDNKDVTPEGDGTFTLTYTTTYKSAYEIDQLGYDYRIQGEKGTPASFYVDSIKVTVIPNAGQPEVIKAPVNTNVTLPVGTTVTLYDLDKDPKLAAGADMTNSPALVKAGSPTISVVKGDDGTLSLYVADRKNDYDSVDLLRTAFKQNNAYYNGDYNFTVKGHIAKEAVTPDIGFKIGMTQSPYGELAKATVASDGTFTIKYTKKTAVDISTIAYDYRIQSNAAGKEVAYYIDSIIVTATGTNDTVVVPKWDLTLPSLADTYKDAFLVGNIMSPEQTTDKELTAMYKKQYNVVTAENAMKPEQLSKTKGVYDYVNADKLISWAQENGILVHGHTLVWHSQSAAWLTTGSSGALTRAEAKANMEAYINAVATHFKGKLISWDVVNEAFANDVYTAPTDWKAVLRGAAGVSDKSPWYAAYANGADASKGESGADFIYDAFVFTRLADPGAKLFYNDYNETELGKREAIAMMVEQLNQKWKTDPQNTNPSRPLIEGVGMQAHYWTAELNPADVEASIQRFIKAGADVSVSELDIPVGTYTTYQQNTELTAANEKLQAELYAKLFDIYKKYASKIDRVTFWGKADPQSWRSEGYPLLFDNTFAPKDAFYAIMPKINPTKTPEPTKKPTPVPTKAPTIAPTKAPEPTKAPVPTQTPKNTALGSTAKLKTTNGLIKTMPPSPEKGKSILYTVQKGETFWSIEYNYYGSMKRPSVNKIRKANALLLKKSNGRLEAGMVLTLPASGMMRPITQINPNIVAGMHLIKRGDTLSGIAKAYYGDAKLWRKLYNANKDRIRLVKGSPMIYEKQWLIIPE